MSFLIESRKWTTDSGLLYLCIYVPVWHSPCYKCTSSFETCRSSAADDSLSFSRQQCGLYLSVSVCHTPYLPCVPSHITLSLLSIRLMAGWNLLSALGPAGWSLIQKKASTTAWCSLMTRESAYTVLKAEHVCEYGMSKRSRLIGWTVHMDV